MSNTELPRTIAAADYREDAIPREGSTIRICVGRRARVNMDGTRVVAGCQRFMLGEVLAANGSISGGERMLAGIETTTMSHGGIIFSGQSFTAGDIRRYADTVTVLTEPDPELKVWLNQGVWRCKTTGHTHVFFLEKDSNDRPRWTCVISGVVASAVTMTPMPECDIVCSVSMASRYYQDSGRPVPKVQATIAPQQRQRLLDRGYTLTEH